MGERPICRGFFLEDVESRAGDLDGVVGVFAEGDRESVPDLVRPQAPVGRVGGNHADLGVVGGEGLAADGPVAALDLFDNHPGDLAHALAFDGDHRVGEFLDDPALLLGGEHVLDELDVDERHFFSLASRTAYLR